MPTAVPFVRWQAFHLVKAGNAAAEYEDAFAVRAERARFAVADGASEASFAGVWARLLANGFVAAHKPWRNLDWLPPLRQHWATEVDSLPLPWYAEAKREQGAFATLLGVGFRAAKPDRPGTWRALAIGDSCLFRIHGGRLRTSFPLSRSTDFGNQPRLLGSRSDNPSDAGKSELRGGHWRPGDRFLLMTDALAQWFLHAHEQGGQPWEDVSAVLSAATPDEAFVGWIEELRQRDALRNDDVTLLAIDPGLVLEE
jgi:hypothetical protein